MEKKPLISIIVPVYKVERFLEKCVSSILAQTLTDFELILVDDGSPDSCPQLCDQLAERDDRIIVIHQTNKGLSGARNAGLDIARGSYVGFVDSDDYIAPDMYEKLLTAIEREDAQIAISSFCVVDTGGTPLDSSSGWLAPGVMTGDQVIHMIPEKNANPYLVAWNKLYRREIFETLRYETGKVNEDTRIFNALFYGLRRVACIEDALYYYVSSDNSITRGKASLRHLDNAEAFYECFVFYEQKGIIDLLAPVEKRIFAKLTGVYYRLDAADRRSERMKELLRFHKDALRILARYKQLRPAVLARSLAFHWLPGLYGLRHK